METKAEIIELLNIHLVKYPSDKKSLNDFFQFLDHNEGSELVSRKNFAGHITASAFIIKANAEKLLLLKHRSLNRWLQPGGHIDSTDISLLHAALREAEEETGIAAKNLQPVFKYPFDYDSHFIPENIKKQECRHYHHDVRFLFICPAEIDLNISNAEATASKWIDFHATHCPEFKKVGHRIREIMKR